MLKARYGDLMTGYRPISNMSVYVLHTCHKDFQINSTFVLKEKIYCQCLRYQICLFKITKCMLTQFYITLITTIYILSS